MCVRAYLKGSKGKLLWGEAVKIDISQIGEVDRRILVSRFYEAIKTFYENPVNLQRFEEWPKEKGKQQFSKPFTQNSPQK